MESSAKKYSFARDAFIYLLSYATLIIFSVGLNFLLKAITNRFIPDAVERFDFLSDDSTIIGFLAAVIIAFPIFIYLNYRANKMLGQGKMLHNTGVRNWLIYLTLVVVILIIIWQIISLFVQFLNGTLVARFLVHTLITLIIAAGVLWYQWWHLKFFDGNARALNTGFKVFEWIVYVVVAAAVVGTFFIIDSPATRRAERLDDIRVNNLASIRYAITSFYHGGLESGLSGRNRLPNDFEELLTDPRVFLSRSEIEDPETNELYGYEIINSTTYKLCADFDTEWRYDDQDTPRAMPRPVEGKTELFYHGAGRECFDLNVD